MNTITIFLTDDQTALRISFTYDASLVERIKTIQGAEWRKAARYWQLPITALDKLIKEFGDQVAVHPDVFMAAPAKTPIMHFAETLRQAGITLADVDGRLVGSGGCYCQDPWQKLIDERADQLRRLAPVTTVTTPLPVAPPADLSKLTEIDLVLARGWDGLVEREARKAEMIERRKAARWHRAEPEQPVLVSE